MPFSPRCDRLLLRYRVYYCRAHSAGDEYNKASDPKLDKRAGKRAAQFISLPATDHFNHLVATMSLRMSPYMMTG